MRLQEYEIGAQTQATVVDSQRITAESSTDEVREIVMDIPPGAFEIEAGQNVGVLLPGDRELGQQHHLRLYSISDVPQQTDGGATRIHLCVQRCSYIDEYSGEEFRGLASNFLCDLRPGETLTLSGPYAPPFPLPVETDATLIMFAIGTGIAPFRALVKQVYQGETPFAGRVWLFHGARSGLELIYMNDIRNEFAQYDDVDTFQAFTALSNRPHWTNAVDWKTVLETRREELWKLLELPNTYVYLAGLERIRDELDAEFAQIAGSAENWDRRKAELVAGNRWVELLY